MQGICSSFTHLRIHPLAHHTRKVPYHKAANLLAITSILLAWIRMRRAVKAILRRQFRMERIVMLVRARSVRISGLIAIVRIRGLVVGVCARAGIRGGIRSALRRVCSLFGFWAGLEFARVLEPLCDGYE